MKTNERRDPKLFVRMFQPRFVGLLTSGLKTQTVRKIPKRMPGVGDRLSLRVWTGAPYRSKQEEIEEVVIQAIYPVAIRNDGMKVNGAELGPRKRDAFARNDGFLDWEELRDWFVKNHSLPFEGIVIHWA